MFGTKRTPDVIYARSELVFNQIKWLQEKQISSRIFSAAEDILAVEGNVFKLKQTGDDEKVYYLNSSHYLVQGNVLRSPTSKL